MKAYFIIFILLPFYIGCSPNPYSEKNKNCKDKIWYGRACFCRADKECRDDQICFLNICTSKILIKRRYPEPTQEPSNEKNLEKQFTDETPIEMHDGSAGDITIEDKPEEATHETATESPPEKQCVCPNRDYRCVKDKCIQKTCTRHKDCKGICQFDPISKSKKCFPCAIDDDCKAFTPSRPYCIDKICIP